MPIPQMLQLWQTAENQMESGQREAARATYQGLVADPELAPMAHLRLSLIATEEGRYRDAVDAGLAAWKAKVADPDLLEMVAKRLFMLGELEAAVAAAVDPAVLGTREVSTLAELGKMLSDASFPAQALQLLEQARTIGLNTPFLRYLIGLNWMYSGEPEKARNELEGALHDMPGMPLALWTLSKIKGQLSDGSDRVERVSAAIIDSRNARKPDNPLLQYALFNELDKRDQIDAAWQALEVGMRARRREVNYDSQAEQALFERLGGLGAATGVGHITDGPRPVFIVGMPRSGTTLLERILGHHPGLTDAGELRDWTMQLRWCCDLAGDRYLDMKLAQKAESIDWAELGKRYLDHTQWRARGAKVYTDKLPINFVNVAYIARALPQARILHMVRGPMDTCFSNLKELFAGAYPHSYDQAEMAQHYRRYWALMARWRAAFPGRILDVHYDELVTEPERVARQVLEFCGLPWQEDIVAIENRTGIVATASAMQVREPIHRRFMGQWRRYEAHLEPLKQALGVLAY